ncbi:MAG: Eco57I restriction-modification methylase domain-containing protein [bacterium]
MYVYFFLRGLNLLKEKGVLCYICSNSWLDVGYGGKLQEILLRTAHVKAIFDNSAMRSFKKADVNTTINLFVKNSTAAKQTFEKGKKLVDITTWNTARFVMFRRPFEEAAQAAHLRDIHSATKITSNDNYRVYPITQKELWQAGLEEGEDGEVSFAGDKWGGKYLRAPDIFFTILEKGKDKLVRLGDIADVRFGIKTGANEFFYLDEQRIVEWKIEKEFLQSVIKSPRECKRILIDPKELKYKIFMCHKEKKELKGTNALKYIEWGERQGFHIRSSCSGRQRWWDLGSRAWGKVLWAMIHNDRPVAYLNLGHVVVDHNLFEIIHPSCYETWASLCSSINVLFRELFGRANLGEGALKTEGIDIKKFFVLCPTVFNRTANEIEKIALQLNQREGKSVYNEVGIDKNRPVRTQQPNPLPDRKALDDIIFDALGLTPAERKEVYWAVCELVQNRLNKAKSFSSKQRSEHDNEEETTGAKQLQQSRSMEKAGEIKRRATKAA